MKLRQRQVADPRAQENFEQLEGILSALLGGDYKIRFGTATVTFTVSNFSNVVTVQHSLGRVPVSVVCTNQTGAGIDYTATAFTGTTFTVQGDYPYGTLNQVAACSWIAIG